MRRILDGLVVVRFVVDHWDFLMSVHCVDRCLAMRTLVLLEQEHVLSSLEVIVLKVRVLGNHHIFDRSGYISYNVVLSRHI